MGTHAKLTAKRASEAPWVKEIGKPSRRKNLVMTSAYKGASVRPSVQTLGEGKGGLEVTRTKEQRNYIFAWREIAHTYVTLRFWAARVFLAGNSMKIALY